MALETGDYIDDLVPTNPQGIDPKSQGDDHLRLIKKCVQQSWPNIDAAVSATPTEINSWEARIAALESQLGVINIPGENILVDGEARPQVKVVVATGATTILDAEVNHSIHCTGTAPYTITLPTGGIVGKQHMIFNWTAGEVTIAPAGSDNLNSIQGAGTNIVLAEYGAVAYVVRGDATNWYASAPE